MVTLVVEVQEGALNMIMSKIIKMLRIIGKHLNQNVSSEDSKKASKRNSLKSIIFNLRPAPTIQQTTKRVTPHPKPRGNPRKERLIFNHPR